MSKLCSHCGEFLHENASFCPHCARSINRRTKPLPPNPVWGKILRLGVVLMLIAGFVLGAYIYNRPLVLDGVGEVIYNDEDGKYQLLLGFPEDRYQPVPELEIVGELDDDYRTLSRLLVNLADSGADARQIFLQKVEMVTAEIIQSPDSVSPMACSEPAPSEYVPEAALVSTLSFTGRSGTAELLWTIKMKNGDTILLRQRVAVEPIETYDFYPEDYAMNTIADLQALIREIEQTVHWQAMVNIHLPPVVYEGGLTMEERPINLYGSTDGEHRTTFTDTVRVAAWEPHIIYFRDIDFVGEADQVGISASAKLHIIGCNISGWKTGVLGYGYAWVSVVESQLENNGIGFHFNSAEGEVSHSMYNGNRFVGNGTAVLLEKVPSDATLYFRESLFSRNGKDIDNLCDQPLDISEAIFQ